MGSGPETVGPPRLPEQSDLTVDHWQEIKNRFANASENHKRVLDVATAVIEGRIQDPNPYLGTRHWGMISRISTTDKKTAMPFFIPDIVRYVPNKHAEEAATYSKKMFESEKPTAQDILEQYPLTIGRSLNYSQNDIWLGMTADRFVWVDDCWRGYSVKFELGKKDEQIPVPGDGSPIDDKSVALHVRNLWNLKEGDCSDILHTPPETLSTTLLGLARKYPDEYGREELEVPKAA